MSVSRIKLGAILVGWITSLFILFVIIAGAIGIALSLNIDLASSLNKNGQPISFSFNFVIFVSMFISFFVGGYVAGRMAALAGAINGAMIVVLSLLALLFACTFVVIVGNSLGIDVLGPIIETIGSVATTLVIIVILAVIGGTLGGKLGEGYFIRLDTALARQERSAKTEQEGKVEEPVPMQLKDKAPNKELEQSKHAG
ncbi:MAG: hypothetical protein IBX64_00715 [Actinobacteria bacterium]|nr:hypothetical protein [Actinomycetota bacterium]